MKSKVIKIAIFFPCLFLTACGYGLRDIYQGDLYNSPIWEKNYYRDYDPIMKDIVGDQITLNENDYPFYSFDDENFKLEEPDVTSMNIYSEGEDSYGMNNSLNNVDESFKEGYVSKLFDGRLFCFGRYETVRVQIDESGFGKMFAKEMVKGEYFLMHFKSSLDFKSQPELNIEEHLVDIDLHVSFYYKGSENYYKHTIVTNFPSLKSNALEPFGYVAFGFSLKNIETERLCGVSVSYKLNKESFNEKHGTSLAHSLLLYEIMFPKSTWR